MSRLRTLAGALHQHQNAEETPGTLGSSDEYYREQCLIALKELFLAQPPVETVIYDLIALLLILPVHDRIYVQRALRPLALKLDCSTYLTDLSRVLQETDAWVDLNILTDKGRRHLPDMGLEISPEFKLP